MGCCCVDRSGLCMHVVPTRLEGYEALSLFATDCKELIAMIKESHVWPSFATKLERIETLLICFPDFNIIYVPRARNQLSDFLTKTARSFERELLFIGCSIPAWLPRPPQV
ncbi:hypothetical protein Bca4012_081084 [Brassica carinata]